MANGSKIFLIVSAIIGAGAAGAYYYVKQNNKKLQNKLAPDPIIPAGTTQTNIAAIPDASNFPIKMGSSGQNVILLQAALGMPESEQDGKFGIITQAMLVKVTGKTRVNSLSDLTAIEKNQSTNVKNSDREQTANTLFNNAMAKKSASGDYIMEPVNNLQVYEVKKFAGIYINTSTRLITGNPYEAYDYLAFTPYENVRIVQINNQGFLTCYDQNLDKYFFTSPYDWQIAA